ncbi:MAG: c-type cytochrome, partial [Myxococcota bacterium]
VGERAAGVTRRAPGRPKERLSPLHDEPALGLRLDSLSPDAGVVPKPQSWLIVERGEALFWASGCSSCHSGSTFTDHELHRTPGHGERKTPTLRGVGLRTRLLSDGGARTVRQLLSLGPHDSHGDVASMAPDDFDALVAYVESL